MQPDVRTHDKSLTLMQYHSGNYYYIKNVCERTVKIFFSQFRDLTEGGEAEEQVNERERTNRRVDVSARPTPPIVRRGKTKSQQAKGKEKAPPKSGPPKGRKKK